MCPNRTLWQCTGIKGGGRRQRSWRFTGGIFISGCFGKSTQILCQSGEPCGDIQGSRVVEGGRGAGGSSEGGLSQGAWGRAPRYSVSLENFVVTYRDQGWWKEAEVLEVPVREACLRMLGEAQPNNLSAMGSFVIMYNKQGHWAEAQELQL